MKYLAALSLIGGLSLAYSQPVLGSPSSSNIEQRVQEIDSELTKLDQEKRLLQSKNDFERHLNNADKYLQVFISDDLLTVEEQKMICFELIHSIGLANQNQRYLEVPEIWKTRYQQMKDNYGFKILPFGVKESGLEQELRNSGYKDVVVEYDGFWDGFGKEIGETFIAFLRVGYWLAAGMLYTKVKNKIFSNRKESSKEELSSN